MAKTDKNPNAVNAPSNDEILKDMNAAPPIAHQVQNSAKSVDDLMKGYTNMPIVDEPAAQEFAKKKRGRKPGQKAGMSASDVTDMNPETTGMIGENPIITGGLLMLLIDLALPNVIALINNKVSKSKITASTLQLSEDERKQLEPLADQVAREMSVKANPLTVLIISLVGLYGMKLMQQKS
jgi:hypothetical protein